MLKCARVETCCSMWGKESRALEIRVESDDFIYAEVRADRLHHVTAIAMFQGARLAADESSRRPA